MATTTNTKYIKYVHYIQLKVTQGACDSVEKKKKEKTSLLDLYLHPKLFPGLIPYRLFYRVGIASRKMVYRFSYKHTYVHNKKKDLS